MQKVRVRLGSNGYDAVIGSGVLASTGACLGALGFSGKLVIITDDNVKKLYGEALAHTLRDGGFNVTLLSVPAGEGSKSLDTAAGLYEKMTAGYAERGTPVLALGGGVVGDLAGFVAATYMRGVPLVQVPTTLLAQVDSSVGGKVGVDHGSLKNKIGVFYQPRLVITDVDTLSTLPEPEMCNGLAEVIKSAAIRNKGLFAFLEKNMEGIKSRDRETLEHVVCRTAGIKADVVAEDERDTGVRNILNYGHTVGHAIESVSGYNIPHGAAVAMGMVAAGRIASRLGKLEGKEAFRIKKLIEKAGLPVTASGLDAKALMQAMKHDKKISGDRIRFILLEKIGSAVISDEVIPSLLEEVLADYE